MGIVIDAVRIEVVEAKDIPIDAAHRWFMWKDGSGIFLKLEPDRYVYIAKSSTHGFVSGNPISNNYVPVNVTIHT